MDTNDDYYREFDNKLYTVFKYWLSGVLFGKLGSLVAVLPTAAAVNHGVDIEPAILGYAAFVIISQFFGYFLLYRHRKMADQCVQKCGSDNKSCYYGCYVNVTKGFMSRLIKNIREIKSNNSLSPKQKEKLIYKIIKRLEYFARKLEKFSELQKRHST
jgi:hypothetical protein